MRRLIRGFSSAARRSSKRSSGALSGALSLDAGARDAALQAAIDQIEGASGKGSIMLLGDRPHMRFSDDQVVPTGSLTLDLALGIGGLPKGRIVEVYGPESCGKTTLTLHVVAEAQRKGLKCVFIDAEHALDYEYARKLGVNLDELYLSQPDSGEQALEIADVMVRSGAVGVIVIDSVAALTPKAELEGNMGDHHMALQARLMSQALRKLSGSLYKSNTILIFINQLRHKVGVMFGSPETTSGGNALKYYASVRLDVRKGAPIKAGEDIVANRTKVKVVKNKVAPPFKIAEFDLEFGKGISQVGELVDLGISSKVLRKSGSHIYYGEQQIGHGREKAKIFLKSKENAELYNEIKNKITEAVLNPNEDVDLEQEVGELEEDMESEELSESIYGAEDFEESTKQ